MEVIDLVNDDGDGTAIGVRTRIGTLVLPTDNYRVRTERRWLTFVKREGELFAAEQRLEALDELMAFAAELILPSNPELTADALEELGRDKLYDVCRFFVYPQSARRVAELQAETRETDAAAPKPVTAKRSRVA